MLKWLNIITCDHDFIIINILLSINAVITKIIIMKIICRQLTCSQEAYIADVSIRCSNPPQGEMKLDCKYCALYKLSRLRQANWF